MSSKAHIGRLQRLHVSQQAALKENEFTDNLMRTEVAAVKNIALIVNYFTWNWHNRWSLLQRLITVGELDIVLSPRDVSWLSELEYERSGTDGLVIILRLSRCLHPTE